VFDVLQLDQLRQIVREDCGHREGRGCEDDSHAERTRMREVDGTLTEKHAALPVAKAPERGNGGSKQPGYRSIVDTIAERIAKGEYPPGGRLPSGSELRVEFGVSPMTVTRALAALKGQGLVSSVKGRGTYVRSLDLSNSNFKLASVEGAWLDGSSEIRLLSVSMARADERTAAKLHIAKGERVVNLRRLVMFDGRPAMFHTEYVICDPLRPLLESQLQLTSLHAFLDSERGRRFPKGELTVRAASLDADTAHALEEVEGAPVLCLEHLFRDADGCPVSFGWFLLRAEWFQLSARLEAEHG
jgi:GntR family transcriptional regulator